MDASRLRNERKIAREEMISLHNNPHRNYTVGDPDYLALTIRKKVLPLKHSKGLFMYYSKIQKALTHALDHGYIPREMLPPRAHHLRKIAK